jgi:hypothetical protein
MALRHWSNQIEGFINDSADRAGVSRSAFRALLYSETQNGENNKQGYIGYGQLGKGVISDYKLTPNQASDPYTNIDTAAKYYSSLVSKFNGDETKAAWYYKGLHTISPGDHANSVFKPFLDNLTALRSGGDSNNSQSAADSPAKSGDVIDPKQGANWLDMLSYGLDIFRTMASGQGTNTVVDPSGTNQASGTVQTIKDAKGTWDNFKKYLTPASMSLIFLLVVLVIVTASGFIAAGNPVTEVIKNG